jgi:hypothetical protein
LARTFHELLYPMIRMGFGGAFLRNRSLTETASTRHLHENKVLDLVRDVLKRSDARFAIYQGKVSPVRKPTLLALDKSGALLAFAKVGWNELTRELVQTEHRTLTLLEPHKFRFGRTAPVLGYYDFGHSNVVLSGPMPGVKYSAELKLTPLHSAFLQEVGALDLRYARLLQSLFWARINDRLAQLGEYLMPEHIEVLERGLEVLQHGLGTETLPWALRLGDFLPWNFGIDQGKKQIEVIDLEFAEADSVIGWDVFHFLIGVQPRFEGLDLERQWRSKPFRDYFDHFGIRSEIVPYLQLAYLIDLSLFLRKMWEDQALWPAAENNHRIRLEAIARVIEGITSGVSTLRRVH